MLTDRDFRVLAALANYYVLNRPQIQGLCFPTDRTGRVTRRRLQTLLSQKLVNRHQAQLAYPGELPTGSIYYPAKRGCQLLAEHTGNDSLVLTPTQCPQHHHILHWLAVSETHIKLDKSFELQETPKLDGSTKPQDKVELDGWINEWDVVNKDETEPSERFRLYTLLDAKPRLICSPDAAFMLSLDGFSKVFYLEQDRATTGVRQLVAKKLKGYRELANRALHARHFPTTNVDSFTVLCVVPNPSRRDRLCHAFKSLETAELWKFAVASDLTSETFLHQPVWHTTDGDVVPLVKQDKS